MRTRRGQITEFTVDAGPKEADTKTCIHCNGVTRLPPGRPIDETMDYCLNCGDYCHKNRAQCLDATTRRPILGCRPFELWLDQTEAEGRRLSRLREGHDLAAGVMGRIFEIESRPDRASLQGPSAGRSPCACSTSKRARSRLCSGSRTWPRQSMSAFCGASSLRLGAWWSMAGTTRSAPTSSRSRWAGAPASPSSTRWRTGRCVSVSRRGAGRSTQPATGPVPGGAVMSLPDPHAEPGLLRA